MLSERLLMKRMPLWPTVLAYFTQSYYQHLGQVSTLKGHLLAVMCVPKTQLLSDRDTQSATQSFRWLSAFVYKAFAEADQEDMGATVPVFLKWYLLPLKIKVQVNKDRQSSTEMTHVGKQNGNDGAGQRKKPLVGWSSCSFKSAGCSNYLRNCWCLDFFPTDLELCSF